MHRSSLARAARAFLNDESGAVMAEYALVMVGLTISGILAFELIGNTGNAAVANNETQMTSTSLVAP